MLQIVHSILHVVQASLCLTNTEVQLVNYHGANHIINTLTHSLCLTNIRSETFRNQVSHEYTLVLLVIHNMCMSRLTLVIDGHSPTVFSIPPRVISRVPLSAAARVAVRVIAVMTHESPVSIRRWRIAHCDIGIRSQCEIIPVCLCVERNH